MSEETKFERAGVRQSMPGSTDPLRQYLNEIGQHPLLTAEEEVVYGTAIQAGIQASEALGEIVENDLPIAPEQRAAYEDLIQAGKEAKHVMVTSNLRLVVSVAKKYSGGDMDLLDLIQEGNIGLNRAADLFDATKGFKFSTYASWWIRQAISRAIAEQSRTIRMPVHAHELMARVKRVVREAESFGVEATPEMFEAANIDTETAQKYLSYDASVGKVLSLDTPVSQEDSSMTLADLVGEKSFEDDWVDNAFSAAVHSMLDDPRISPRERQIVRERFGLDDGQPKTLQEVANQHGVTRERIRQVQEKVLNYLRNSVKYDEELLAKLDRRTDLDTMRIVPHDDRAITKRRRYPLRNQESPAVETVVEQPATASFVVDESYSPMPNRSGEEATVIRTAEVMYEENYGKLAANVMRGGLDAIFFQYLGGDSGKRHLVSDVLNGVASGNIDPEAVEQLLEGSSPFLMAFARELVGAEVRLIPIDAARHSKDRVWRAHETRERAWGRYHDSLTGKSSHKPTTTLKDAINRTVKEHLIRDKLMTQQVHDGVKGLYKKDLLLADQVGLVIGATHFPVADQLQKDGFTVARNRIMLGGVILNDTDEYEFDPLDQLIINTAQGKKPTDEELKPIIDAHMLDLSEVARYTTGI